MNTISGFVYAPMSGRPSSIMEIPPQSIQYCNLILPDKEWDVGIDQSTTCTGITYFSTDGTALIMLEVPNDKYNDSRVYYNDIFRFLQRTAKGKEFRSIIIEKPAPKKMYASKILQELKGRVETWIDMIPEFDDILKDSIYHQTWTSFVVDKTKGKKRADTKAFVAEDLSDKFPCLKENLKTYHGGYDSYDSFGIIYGFRKYAFDQYGNELIHGEKKSRQSCFVGYHWVDCLDSALEPIKELVSYKSPEPLEFNTRYSLYENIQMAASNWEFVVTTVPRSEQNSLMWKYDFDPDKEGYLVMFILNKRSLANSEIDYLERCLPWGEMMECD